MSRMDRYNDEVWRCPNCGKYNGIESKFCTGCGSPRAADGYGSYGGYPGYGEDAYVAEPPKKKGGAGKAIAIFLIVLLVAGGLGFGAYKFISSRQKDKGTDVSTSPPTTEQSDSSSTDSSADSSSDSSQSTTQSTPEPEEDDDDDSYYKVGNTYTVIEPQGVRIRTGPGTSYAQVELSDISSEYESQCIKDGKGTKACLKKGATVTCLEMQGNWMRITDGWVCVEYDGETLIR